MTFTTKCSSIFTQIKENCSGCGACAQICKHQAISMKEDSEGFLYPNINLSKCVDCGICDRICPEVNAHQENNIQETQAYYLATNRDKTYSKKCATIGVCSMISQYIIEKQGAVFGVVLNESIWKAEHICLQDQNGIEKVKNSKYIQSNTKATYNEAKMRLQKNQIVLYIGTPCQIAGLKAFLRKEYSNLYTIDLICHGTFSYKLLQKEISYWEKELKGKIYNFRFRSKKIYPWNMGGIINFDYKNSKGKIKHVERPGYFSPTYRSYAYSPDNINYNLRQSCYSCKFRSSNRYGDLTVGDAWGIEKYKQEIFSDENKRTGISVILSNTQKGNYLIKNIQELLILTELNKDEVFTQPALLPTNRTIPNKRYEIYNNLDKEEYGSLISKTLNFNFHKSYKEYKKKFFKQKVKIYIKLLLKKVQLIH